MASAIFEAVRRSLFVAEDAIWCTSTATFVAGAIFGAIQLPLFEARAIFDDVGLLLFAANAIFGASQLSLICGRGPYLVMLDCHFSWQAYFS